MREIHTEMIMATSAQRVWDVLTDFAAYPSWNPFIREARGELRVGSHLRLRLKLGKLAVPLTTKLVRVEPGRALVWRGSLPFGLFTGEHAFEITAEGPDQVRFHHWERFDGRLVPALGKVFDQLKRAYDQFNVALERRATAN